MTPTQQARQIMDFGELERRWRWEAADADVLTAAMRIRELPETDRVIVGRELELRNGQATRGAWDLANRALFEARLWAAIATVLALAGLVLSLVALAREGKTTPPAAPRAPNKTPVAPPPAPGSNAAPFSKPRSP